MRDRPRWGIELPVLSKSRHELFAQAVANGSSLDDAHSDAGFIRNRGNASKLMRNTAIQSRVDELLQAKLPSNYTIRILHSGSGPHQLVPRRHAVERRRNGRRYNPQSVRSPLARAGPLKRHRLRARCPLYPVVTAGNVGPCLRQTRRCQSTRRSVSGASLDHPCFGSRFWPVSPHNVRTVQLLTFRLCLRSFRYTAGHSQCFLRRNSATHGKESFLQQH